MAEDYSQPRSLADTFLSMELNEVSSIHKGPKPTPSKYEETTDDDPLDINLDGLMVSNVIKKGSLKAPTQRHKRAKPTQKRQTDTHKPQVDIDKEIGEVAEWQKNKATDYKNEEDFNEGEKVGQSKQQMQIRRRVEQKLKNGFGNTNNGGGGGLRAKAEQLARENQLRRTELTAIIQKEEQQIKDSLPISKAKQKPKQTPLSSFKKQPSQNESGLGLLANSPESKKKAKRQEHTEERLEEGEDQHWDKINQGTIDQYNQREQKRKELNFQTVTTYFKEEFKFDQADIDDEQIGKNTTTKQESQEVGCLQALFACFAQPKKGKADKTNLKLAKRLVAISKKQMDNGEQQFWLLKQIWLKLTSKPFGRHGAHWTEIGFQGRDPATDLRSTGILSLLQWTQFIESHPQQSQSNYVWSTQNEFPLALTHIKMTGVFLGLLAQGKIDVSSWEEAQKGYNCLVIAIFRRMNKNYKLGDTLGSSVEEGAREIKDQYAKLKGDYDREFKKSKK